MTKINAVLLAMLLTCALLLVTSQHQARKSFIALERAQALARKHEVEWNQLQLEQTQLAKHSRIDQVARRELRMQPVTPERTLYLAAPAGKGGADAASVPAEPSVPPVAAVRGIR